MHIRKLIFLIAIFLLFISNLAHAQSDVKLTAKEITDYTEQSKQLAKYLEGTLNFLGDPSQVTSEKDVIINESYLKAFESDETQVEDDLDPNREMAMNKNIQAYLKDVVFFFKKVTFTFEVNSVDQLVSETGQVVFKVTMNRNLSGVTVNNDTLDNNQIRYMEVNLNPVQKDLKIASLYTTKPDRSVELKYWWENMHESWKNFFGDSVMVIYTPAPDSLIDPPVLHDTLPFSNILTFTDSTFVTGRWKEDLRIDTLMAYDGDTVPFQALADSLKFEADLLVDTTIHYLKVYDTITYDGKEIYKQLTAFSSSKTIDISANESLMNLNPLTELNDLMEVNLSKTAINDLSPLRNLNKMQSLNCAETPVNSLDPLRFASNLRELDFSGTQVADISVLANLKNLNKLKMGNSKVSSLESLSDAESLSQLDLTGLDINDFSSLEELPNLTDLDLTKTSATDLGSIGKIKNLQSLNISDTYVTRLDALKDLSNLGSLQCNNSKISNLESLTGMTHLKFIYCDNSGIDDIKAANFMDDNPQTLVIFNTKRLEKWWTDLPVAYKDLINERMTISDPVTTEELHAVISQTEVNLSNLESIETIEPLSMLHRLEKVNLENTAVSDLEPLSGLNNLAELNLNNTGVNSLQYLSNLRNLKTVRCENTGIENLLPLQGNSNLQLIYCDGSQIDEQNVLKIMDSVPECLVVYQSEKLKTWWDDLSSDWQDIFIDQFKFDGSYSKENLQLLVNMREINIIDKSFVTDLEPMSWFLNLRKLTVSNTKVSDITPLLELTYLEEINMPNNPIVQLPGIAKIKSIRKLNLESTSIEDLTVVGSLSWLVSLNIGGTKVKKLKGVDGLSSLEFLAINNTTVKSLKGLEKLQNLKELKCYRTEISSKNIDKFKDQYPRITVEYY